MRDTHPFGVNVLTRVAVQARVVIPGERLTAHVFSRNTITLGRVVPVVAQVAVRQVFLIHKTVFDFHASRVQIRQTVRLIPRFARTAGIRENNIHRIVVGDAAPIFVSHIPSGALQTSVWFVIVWLDDSAIWGDVAAAVECRFLGFILAIQAVVFVVAVFYAVLEKLGIASLGVGEVVAGLANGAVFGPGNEGKAVKVGAGDAGVGRLVEVLAGGAGLGAGGGGGVGLDALRTVADAGTSTEDVPVDTACAVGGCPIHELPWGTVRSHN